MPKWRSWPWHEALATLQNAVTATDQQMDAPVYGLYGLTADEIKLVGGGA